MQTVNATYNSIISGRYIVEYKIQIGSDTYSQSDIFGVPVISQALFDKFSVGNAVAGELKVTLKPKGTIPTMALLEVFARVKNASLTSDWIPKGKYYIDTRKLDHNGYLSLECYDAMLKGEYTFMTSGTWTSTTALATVNMVTSDMGISAEGNTLAVLTNDPKNVDYVPNIGEDGTTGREMLTYIASMYGGNFIIDEEGDLKLIQLTSPSDTAPMGALASSLDTAPAYDAIDRVIMYGLNKEEGFKSPESTFDSLTGRILEVTCPWTSQTLADDLLDIVDGYVYQPLEATNVPLPPHYQLGDGITINGTTSIIASEVINLNAAHLCEISAPFEEEVNHEYPYRSPAQRTIDNAVTQEQLRTAGQTTINGGNIMTDTIQTEGTYPSGVHGVTKLEAGTVHSEGTNGEENYEGIFEASNIELTWEQSGDTALTWIEASYIELTQTIGGVTKSAVMGVSPESTLNPITRSSGLGITAQTLKKWGRVATVTLVLTGDGAYHGAGSDIFSGTISIPPSTDVMGCGYYSSTIYTGWMKSDGSINIRLSQAVTFSAGSPIYISWTFVF